ncbi:FG-GAP repeat protein, partial [Rubripirellula amarantea]|nr:FG-GAP repeat protein [Rubripirellula amarantea]
VAGSPQADGGGGQSGRAYAFENMAGTWTQTRVIVNDKVSAADQYGIAIGLSGDVAVVGSWLDNSPANNSGGAYVFDLQIDFATVTVTVNPGSSETLFTAGGFASSVVQSSTPEQSLAPETVASDIGVVAPWLLSAQSARDHVFANELQLSPSSELESYVMDIAELNLQGLQSKLAD